ncbi:hypothetical protein JWJ90_13385 [Desulfobulbus rhabdoformis]|uniref:hypothetical protein n=1 Tax=Desulfobulbus rhabdoformis TaxID=34032 RepID=UPI0019662023|nr:hypothetical protein [Desulfobulbus rhabdoformis]MBM9615271.1 hypothetical protein [Desulfobulbus rhabdoformis]
MNTTNRPKISELTCHQCGRPLEVSTVLTPDGHYQDYLQCWHCFTSTPGRKVMRIPLHSYPKHREQPNSHL